MCWNLLSRIISPMQFVLASEFVFIPIDRRNPTGHLHDQVERSRIERSGREY